MLTFSGPFGNVYKSLKSNSVWKTRTNCTLQRSYYQIEDISQTDENYGNHTNELTDKRTDRQKSQNEEGRVADRVTKEELCV